MSDEDSPRVGIAMTASLKNAVTLSLHVPEPRARPGDPIDFTGLVVPVQVEIQGIRGGFAGIIAASSLKRATMGSIMAEWKAWEVFRTRQPVPWASRDF